MIDIRKENMFPNDVFVFDHLTAIQGIVIDSEKTEWLDIVNPRLQQTLDDAIQSQQYNHYAFNTSLDGWVNMFSDFIDTNPQLVPLTSCMSVADKRWNWFPHWHIVTDTDDPPRANNRHPDYRWQFWIRRPRYQRINLLKHFAKLMPHKGYIIFPHHLIEPTGRTYPPTKELFQDDYLYDSIQSQFQPAIDIPQGENGAYAGSYKLRQNIAIDVVSETMTHEEGGIFFSEKTWKPLRAGQLFIIQGQPFAIQSLRDYGFKTFDDHIDHSYDTERNLDTRTEMIANEVDRLSKLSFREFSKLWADTYTDRLYNQQFKKYNLDYWKERLSSLFV